jgi:hypothetical protein
MNDENGVNLYPTSLITEEKLLLYNQKYNDVNTKLDETRKHEILEKIKEFKRLYDKNIKLKKRWSNSEIGIMISSLIAMGAVAAAVGVFFPVTVALGVGAVSSLIEIVSYGTVHQLIARKQKHYELRSVIIKSYIDKLQLLFDDIIKDNIITDEEYELYLKLIKEYEKDINSNNNEMAKFIEDYKKSMESKIDKEAKKDLKKEILKNLKEKAVADLLQKSSM